MKHAPFPVSPELTSIAIAYRNPDHVLIADQVLPRVGPPLGVKAFKWWEYDLAAGYTVPDTAVGRLGRPNEVNWNATEKDGSTKDYGLDEPVPQDDIDQWRNQGRKGHPLGSAVERVSSLVNLDRERRVAGIVFNAANYAAANVETMAGASQFSDAASDPVAVLLEALDTPIVRPNTIVLGKAVWTKLKVHPKVVKAIYPNGNGEGIATRQQFADLLEVQRLLVGESRINQARKGQAANLGGVWGKHVSMLYLDSTATNAGGVTYGFTLQYGDKVAGEIPDPNIGLRGGLRARVGESVAEVIAAKDVGFFIQNAVA